MSDRDKIWNEAVEACAKEAERFTLGFVVDDHAANIADAIRVLAHKKSDYHHTNRKIRWPQK